MQQMIVFKISAGREVVNKLERRTRAVHHCDGYCSIQRHNRRRLDAFESVVEADDLTPIRVFGARRLAMHSGDCRLKRNRTGPASKHLVDQWQRLRDLLLVPKAPVLILEQDEITGIIQAGSAP